MGLDRSEGARDEAGRPRRARVNTISIAVTLIAILAVAYPLGYALHNANATRAIAVFAIGVVSFLGMLAMGHESDGYRPFDSHEVRTAVTVAFVSVYFAVLGIFIFSTNVPTAFGNTVFGTFTPLMGVILGFYFASSAVERYTELRMGGASGRDAGERAAGTSPAAAAQGPTAPAPTTAPGPTTAPAPTTEPAAAGAPSWAIAPSVPAATPLPGGTAGGSSAEELVREIRELRAEVARLRAASAGDEVRLPGGP